MSSMMMQNKNYCLALALSIGITLSGYGQTDERSKLPGAFENAQDIEKQTKTFAPFYADRENGFYEVAEAEYSGKPVLKIHPTLAFNAIRDVTTATGSYADGTPYAEIIVTFDRKGARKFRRMTRRNIQKPLAVVIDREVVFMPIIQQEISGGKLGISGRFSDEETTKMVEIFTARQGAVPPNK